MEPIICLFLKDWNWESVKILLQLPTPLKNQKIVTICYQNKQNQLEKIGSCIYYLHLIYKNNNSLNWNYIYFYITIKCTFAYKSVVGV